jgi:hypothetical protein
MTALSRAARARQLQDLQHGSTAMILTNARKNRPLSKYSPRTTLKHRAQKIRAFHAFLPKKNPEEREERRAEHTNWDQISPFPACIKQTTSPPPCLPPVSRQDLAKISRSPLRLATTPLIPCRSSLWAVVHGSVTAAPQAAYR